MVVAAQAVRPLPVFEREHLMPFIRRDTAGSDSFGHTWDNPGDVVEVAPEHAQALLAIPDFDGVEVPADEVPPGDRPAARPARKTAAAKG